MQIVREFHPDYPLPAITDTSSSNGQHRLVHKTSFQGLLARSGDTRGSDRQEVPHEQLSIGESFLMMSTLRFAE